MISKSSVAFIYNFRDMPTYLLSLLKNAQNVYKIQSKANECILNSQLSEKSDLINFEKHAQRLFLFFCLDFEIKFLIATLTFGPSSTFYLTFSSVKL